jgi:hypothetical protein
MLGDRLFFSRRVSSLRIMFFGHVEVDRFGVLEALLIALVSCGAFFCLECLVVPVASVASSPAAFLCCVGIVGLLAFDQTFSSSCSWFLLPFLSF